MLTREETDFLKEFRNEMLEVLRRVCGVIVGQDELKESVIVALLSRGHLLIEGMPGLGKTMTVVAFARALNLRGGRLQFTPDLLPSDIVGTEIPVNIAEGKFEFRPGPIFDVDILLADEINRTTPKTHAALLEAMQERRATVDRVTRELSKTFLVLATLNPLEIGGKGTYDLPEAQIDRFLMKVGITYPSLEEERRIAAGSVNFEERLKNIVPVSSEERIRRAQELVPRLFPLDERHPVVDYIARVIRATRLPTKPKSEDADKKIEVGASTRASIDACRASVYLAYLRGHVFVSPAVIQEIIPRILRHRLILSEDTAIARQDPDGVIAEILKKVPLFAGGS